MSTNPPPYEQQLQPPAPPLPPQPQKNWFGRHKFLTALIAIVAMVLLSQAVKGGGDQTPTASTTPADAAAPPAAEKPAAEKPADAKPADAKPADKAPAKPAAKPAGPKVGTAIRDGKFEFTVTKVETGVKSVGPDFMAEKAQGQFVLVHLTVANIGDEPQTLIDSVQKVRDAAGRQFSTDSVAAMVIKGNDVFFNEINPGNTVKGTLVYDMPKNAKPASIELHDSMFSGGVTVSLS